MAQSTGDERRAHVRRYYDVNTWKFLLTGSQRAIHRELWGPGVTNRREAVHHAHALVLDELGPDDRRVLDLGPTALVAKKGENGAVLISPSGVFIAPAFPLESVLDPTGAGDSFAGGFIGYLASVGDLSPSTIKRAMIHGSAVASFAVEDFSVGRLTRLRPDELAARVEQFRELTTFESAGS